MFSFPFLVDDNISIFSCVFVFSSVYLIGRSSSLNVMAIFIGLFSYGVIITLSILDKSSFAKGIEGKKVMWFNDLRSNHGSHMVDRENQLPDVLGPL